MICQINLFICLQFIMVSKNTILQTKNKNNAESALLWKNRQYSILFMLFLELKIKKSKLNKKNILTEDS